MGLSRTLVSGQFLESTHPWLAQTVIPGDLDLAKLLRDLWQKHRNCSPVICEDGDF